MLNQLNGYLGFTSQGVHDPNSQRSLPKTDLSYHLGLEGWSCGLQNGEIVVVMVVGIPLTDVVIVVGMGVSTVIVTVSVTPLKVSVMVMNPAAAGSSFQETRTAEYGREARTGADEKGGEHCQGTEHHRDCWRMVCGEEKEVDVGGSVSCCDIASYCAFIRSEVVSATRKRSSDGELITARPHRLNDLLTFPSPSPEAHQQVGKILRLVQRKAGVCAMPSEPLKDE